MTGRGRGYCLLKIPRNRDEPLTGFAGLSGHPVYAQFHRTETGLESMSARMRTIEAAIHSVQNRLAALEKLARREEHIP